MPPVMSEGILINAVVPTWEWKRSENLTLRGRKIGRMDAGGSHKSAQGEKAQKGKFLFLPQQMMSSGDFFLWFLLWKKDCQINRE